MSKKSPALDPPFDHVDTGGPFSWESLFEFRQDFPECLHEPGVGVCVIGGGIAGLCASYELYRRGYRVTLLESSNRCGGRIFTHHFDDGTYGELGAMRLPVTHQATLDYVERFGLQTRPFIGANPNGFFFLQGQHGQVKFFGDKGADIAQELKSAYPGLSLSVGDLCRSPFDLLLERVIYPVLRELTDEQRWSLFVNGGADSELASWEAHTLRDFVTKKRLDSVRLNAEDWDYIARATGLLYLDSGTFAQFVLDLVPTLGTPMVEIVGGMEQLPNAFLRRLRSEDITLGAKVIGLDVTDAGVAVRWKQEEEDVRERVFDFVICTAPIKRLQNIDIAPQDLEGLAEKREAWRQVQMEHLAKCLFHCDRRFWESKYEIVGGKSFTDESIQQCYYPSDNGRRERRLSGANQWIPRDTEVPDHAGVFTAAYMWGDSAQRYARLEDDERRTREVIAGVDRLHGCSEDDSVRSRIVKARHHVWQEGFTYFRPGQQLRHQENMRKPIGDSSGSARIFFAGEHLGIIHGWILSSIVTSLAAVGGVIRAANSEMGSGESRGS
ncbi:MAG TPA: NAD(P)/FAD-dependent oxidoreductase [Solirubrobacterales bacterium]|nr:NAD(P)/FAD-dependent oxidoreductase [Solirubrobacterales bacterium]